MLTNQNQLNRYYWISVVFWKRGTMASVAAFISFECHTLDLHQLNVQPTILAAAYHPSNIPFSYVSSGVPLTLSTYLFYHCSPSPNTLCNNTLPNLLSPGLLVHHATLFPLLVSLQPPASPTTSSLRSPSPSVTCISIFSSVTHPHIYNSRQEGTL